MLPTFIYILLTAAATAALTIDIPNFVSMDIDFSDAPFSISESGPLLPKPLNELQYHGTTTLAFLYKKGIIVAVDSKASVGSYVGSRTVKKVFPISKHMLATMAGGAADCAFWIRRTARQAKVLEYEHGSPMKVCSVAKLLAASLREYRGSDLSVGTMVAGYDLQTSLPSRTILTVTPLHSRTNSFCSESLLLVFGRLTKSMIHNIAHSHLILFSNIFGSSVLRRF
jgi:Proteasome subunit